MLYNVYYRIEYWKTELHETNKFKTFQFLISSSPPYQLYALPLVLMASVNDTANIQVNAFVIDLPNIVAVIPIWIGFWSLTDGIFNYSMSKNELMVDLFIWQRL